MDQHGLTQQDLRPEIGSESLVSLVLSGKRNLTVAHMRALARRFGVPAAVFLGSADQRQLDIYFFALCLSGRSGSKRSGGKCTL